MRMVLERIVNVVNYPTAGEEVLKGVFANTAENKECYAYVEDMSGFKAGKVEESCVRVYSKAIELERDEDCEITDSFAEKELEEMKYDMFKSYRKQPKVLMHAHHMKNIEQPACTE